MQHVTGSHLNITSAERRSDIFQPRCYRRPNVYDLCNRIYPHFLNNTLPIPFLALISGTSSGGKIPPQDLYHRCRQLIDPPRPLLAQGSGAAAGRDERPCCECILSKALSDELREPLLEPRCQWGGLCCLERLLIRRHDTPGDCSALCQIPPQRLCIEQDAREVFVGGNMDDVQDH